MIDPDEYYPYDDSDDGRSEDYPIIPSSSEYDYPDWSEQLARKRLNFD